MNYCLTNHLCSFYIVLLAVICQIRGVRLLWTFIVLRCYFFVSSIIENNDFLDFILPFFNHFPGNTAPSLRGIRHCENDPRNGPNPISITPREIIEAGGIHHNGITLTGAESNWTLARDSLASITEGNKNETKK